MTTAMLLTAVTFEEFESIPRLFRDMVVTEKIDGTNAQVHVLEDGTVLAGSRNRYITPEADNFGFARWVKENEAELRGGLGVGRHFGEWWGSGIQRGYGLTKGEKRFSLFNVRRWMSPTNDGHGAYSESATNPPACCSVVPILCTGKFCTTVIQNVLANLEVNGSVASRGFMKPEGIVIYHKAGGQLFKYTLDKNDGHKTVASVSDESVKE
jgi:hypothetical protein